MFKKIWAIFIRDFKVNSRDFLALYILILPILFGIAINIFTPGINDTTVNLALIEDENEEKIAYYKDFAKVEVFKDVEGVKKRVNKRDNIVGILPKDDEYYILAQGNEPESVIEMAKLLKTYYELDVQIENTNAEIIKFGRTVPPLKKVLVNIAILFTSILSGMLIAINIVEEKADNTISAINVTTVSRLGFILGKSLIGMILSVFGSIVILLITGFTNVNMGQVILAIFACTLLSLLIGFIQGVNNDDIMSAAASIKLLFLPMIGAVAAIELLSDKWQKLFYWIPFYWTYKGNDAILSNTATWQQIIMYTVIVLALCGLVYFFLAPRIRKGLE